MEEKYFFIRTWSGLEQKLGQTEVGGIVQERGKYIKLF